jgi:transposase-like protein
LTVPAGRPTKYSPELCEQAYKLYLLKATDEEVADFFGVHVDTLHEWRNVHEEFSEATIRGKVQADAEVAGKLRERALGYSHEAVKIFMPAGASEPVYAKYIEHYPPDTQAASLWLRNRQPEKWRDKQDLEHSGPNGTPLQIQIVRFSDAE